MAQQASMVAQPQASTGTTTAAQNSVMATAAKTSPAKLLASEKYSKMDDKRVNFPPVNNNMVQN